MNIENKLERLRQAMKQSEINAYIIPSSDPHMSEYVSEHWKSRAYFSGFTGSAGTLVITETESGLWTDGRYYIQAEKQLEDSEIKLYRMGEKGVLSYIEYLMRHLKKSEVVGIDGRLFSASTMQAMKGNLRKKGIKVKAGLDLVSPLWEDRPKEVLTEVYLHDTRFTGLSCKEKLTQVREIMVKRELDGYVLNELASIAWLFNIRASDIAYNPMAVAYAYITREKAYLYIDGSRLPIDVSMALKLHGVEIKKYEEIDQMLKEIHQPAKVLCNTQVLNYHLYQLLDKNLSVKIVEDSDIIMDLKAVKNEVEIKSIKEAHIKDGCALTYFMVELEKQLANNQSLSEYDLLSMLTCARAAQENNKGESFSSIVGYKENAAMMHYAPTKENHKILEKEGLLLIDSGGQYLEGTTDITRTIALGPITDEERLHYTLVLKSHINMAKAIFMEGCTGANLDILARGPIWAYGLDYKCGTGHGVGFMLGVHEGPQSLRMSNHVPFKKGMLITDEPGIYIQGSHGVRIENILLVTDYLDTPDGKFYQFENVTYFPIDLTPVDFTLLNADEINWLNDYHEMVYNKLAPRLEGEALKWLKEHTQSIIL
ncbi:MAG: aminopeptidase P family protein [Cellulosilyticum sp.]|nr:aminopeptidase P family protein [Cellulosilyticum sp.]